jgi:predicted dehydrogenase
MNELLRVAVIGAGRMGSLHARIYDESPDCRLIAVVDVKEEAARELAEKHSADAFDRIEPILDKVDAVSIAVPTLSHLSASQPFIERRIPCLIEKPIAQDVRSASEIVELAESRGALVAVGHVERFNSAVLAMDRMGVSPKFIETHRISPFTFRSADIGVTFDMMIHDIDVVLHLTGSTLERVDAVGVNVLGPHEDIANARLSFCNGCVANLTASRLAVKTERKIRVFSEEAYLSLDYQKGTGIAIKKDDNLDLLRLASEGGFTDLTDLPVASYADMLSIEPLVVDDQQPLQRELAEFLKAAASGDSSSVGVVTARQGLAAVECAQRVVDAVRAHQWDGGPEGRVGLSERMIAAPNHETEEQS